MLLANSHENVEILTVVKAVVLLQAEVNSVMLCWIMAFCKLIINKSTFWYCNKIAARCSWTVKSPEDWKPYLLTKILKNQFLLKENKTFARLISIPLGRSDQETNSTGRIKLLLIRLAIINTILQIWLCCTFPSYNSPGSQKVFGWADSKCYLVALNILKNLFSPFCLDNGSCIFLSRWSSIISKICPVTLGSGHSLILILFYVFLSASTKFISIQ